MNITQVKIFIFKYIQTILLILGMLLLVIGIGGCLGFFIALILAGLLLIVLAFLINYEKKGK